MTVDQLRPWVGHLRPGPPSSRLPPMAQTDDGNHWVTGRCWLWCGRESARVVWVGSAGALGVTADVFACEACALSLADQVIASQMAEDVSASSLGGLERVGAPAHQSHGPPAGRHRRLP